MDAEKEINAGRGGRERVIRNGVRVSLGEDRMNNGEATIGDVLLQPQDHQTGVPIGNLLGRNDRDVEAEVGRDRVKVKGLYR